MAEPRPAPSASDPRAVHEILIVGGGPSGMAAALVAGRARLSTVLFDAGRPRNAVTRASHGFLSRDGIAPLELRRIAREEVGHYASVRLQDGRVRGVARRDDLFEVTDADGNPWLGRRIVIATGFRDELDRLGVPDLDAVYGKSVFPCPFCDGFEHADEALAIFGAAGAVHKVRIVKVWSADLVVFTNGAPLPEDERNELVKGGIRVEERPIARLHHEGGKLVSVELEGGDRILRQAGFTAADISVPATDFAAQLGVPTVRHPWGMDVVDADDETGRCPVDRVYAVGDARSGFGGVTAAVNQGSTCMAHIVHEIAEERWSDA